MFDTPPEERARRSRGRWTTAALVVTLGLLLVVVISVFTESAARGVTALVGVLAVLGLSWWLSPLRPGRHVPLAETATDHPEVVVLWRPGCSYSSRLRRETERRHSSVAWVNIWRDPEAAAVCRRLNGGQEETPTAVVVDRENAQPVVIPATVAGIEDANEELEVAAEDGRHPERSATHRAA